MEAYSDADWGGDKASRRSVSAWVRSHCLKVWTKKKQVVALSSAESDLYAAVKTASEGLGVQSVAKDLQTTSPLNLHLDASATLRLVNRRGLGKAKHVDMQSLWLQEASKSNRFATKKNGTNVNFVDFMTKPLTKQKIEQPMSIMGYEFLGDDVLTMRDSGNSYNLATFECQCKKSGVTKMDDMTVRVGMSRTWSSDVCHRTKPTQVLLRREVF